MVLPYLCNAITRERPLERDTTVLLKFQKSFKKDLEVSKMFLTFAPAIEINKILKAKARRF